MSNLRAKVTPLTVSHLGTSHYALKANNRDVEIMFSN